MTITPKSTKPQLLEHITDLDIRIDGLLVANKGLRTEASNERNKNGYLAIDVTNLKELVGVNRATWQILGFLFVASAALNLYQYLS